MDVANGGKSEPEKTDELQTNRALQEQIDALRAEIANLGNSVADRLAGAKDVAKDMAASAAGQARDVRDVAAVYPVAMSSSAVMGMLVGLVLGLIMGRSSEPRHWWDRFDR